MKMRYIIILLLTLTEVHAQEGIWTFTDPSSFFVTNIYEEDNGDLLLSVIPVARGNKTTIVRLDKDGRELGIGYLINDTMQLRVFKIIKIHSKQSYLLVGASYLDRDDGEADKYLFTVMMDQDLKAGEVKVTKFDVESEFYNMNYYLTEDERVYLSVNVFTLGDFPNSEQLFLRLNNEGDIEYVYKDVDHPCYSIIEDSDGYVCIGRRNKYFDRNFEYRYKSQNIYWFIGPSNQSRALRINDNKILITTLKALDNVPGPRGGQPVLYYVDNEMNVLKRNWMKAELGSVFADKTFDISPDSSIYVGGFESAVTRLKSFSVGRFDTELNLQWQMQFSDIGNHIYSLWGLEATNDNGVIIYGARKNWTFTYNEAYAIKIDGKGGIINTYNIDQSTIIMHKLYPNPSSGSFILELTGAIDRAEFRVLTMEGKLVYTDDSIMEGRSEIDLSLLPIGTYVYELYDKGKQIGSGKWIKI